MHVFDQALWRDLPSFDDVNYFLYFPSSPVRIDLRSLDTDKALSRHWSSRVKTT